MDHLPGGAARGAGVLGDPGSQTARFGFGQVALDEGDELGYCGPGSPGILLPCDISSLSRSIIVVSSAA